MPKMQKYSDFVFVVYTEWFTQSGVTTFAVEQGIGLLRWMLA